MLLRMVWSVVFIVIILLCNNKVSYQYKSSLSWIFVSIPNSSACLLKAQKESLQNIFAVKVVPEVNFSISVSLFFTLIHTRVHYHTHFLFLHSMKNIYFCFIHIFCIKNNLSVLQQMSQMQEESLLHWIKGWTGIPSFASIFKNLMRKSL